MKSIKTASRYFLMILLSVTLASPPAKAEDDPNRGPRKTSTIMGAICAVTVLGIGSESPTVLKASGKKLAALAVGGAAFVAGCGFGLYALTKRPEKPRSDLDGLLSELGIQDKTSGLGRQIILESRGGVSTESLRAKYALADGAAVTITAGDSQPDGAQRGR